MNIFLIQELFPVSGLTLKLCSHASKPIYPLPNELRMSGEFGIIVGT